MDKISQFKPNYKVYKGRFIEGSSRAGSLIPQKEVKEVAMQRRGGGERTCTCSGREMQREREGRMGEREHSMSGLYNEEPLQGLVPGLESSG